MTSSAAYSHQATSGPELDADEIERRRAMPPPANMAFLAQVDQAVATMPETVETRIREICAEHESPKMRAHLVDWIFFEHWRWGEGWLVDERQGRAIGIFHDPLAQKMRATVQSHLTAT